MIHERATRAIFLTTSDFNQNAVQYAKGKNIDLINGKQFVNMIKS
jgi:restriction endonuclease Mrr